ncbi:MAG: hypothetical protein BJ554DRAFT_5814 [Olpidium bornovanus]|uniref:Uncharacterized protein n=1 Tax=Olpidium bornovanus TaxID=278681 RepID=A0A8H7ZYX0_9FUNG|nr:MAG: hypothetical protein BJ554DRAFT_5814 [Olpidium bornovanus]
MHVLARNRECLPRVGEGGGGREIRCYIRAATLARLVAFRKRRPRATSNDAAESRHQLARSGGIRSAHTFISGLSKQLSEATSAGSRRMVYEMLETGGALAKNLTAHFGANPLKLEPVAREPRTRRAEAGNAANRNFNRPCKHSSPHWPPAAVSTEVDRIGGCARAAVTRLNLGKEILKKIMLRHLNRGTPLGRFCLSLEVPAVRESFQMIVAGVRPFIGAEQADKIREPALATLQNAVYRIGRAAQELVLSEIGTEVFLDCLRPLLSPVDGSANAEEVVESSPGSFSVDEESPGRNLIRERAATIIRNLASVCEGPAADELAAKAAPVLAAVLSESASPITRQLVCAVCNFAFQGPSRFPKTDVNAPLLVEVHQVLPLLTSLWPSLTLTDLADLLGALRNLACNELACERIHHLVGPRVVEALLEATVCRSVAPLDVSDLDNPDGVKCRQPRAQAAVPVPLHATEHRIVQTPLAEATKGLNTIATSSPSEEDRAAASVARSRRNAVVQLKDAASRSEGDAVANQTAGSDKIITSLLSEEDRATSLALRSRRNAVVQIKESVSGTEGDAGISRTALDDLRGKSEANNAMSVAKGNRHALEKDANHTAEAVRRRRSVTIMEKKHSDAKEDASEHSDTPVHARQKSSIVTPWERQARNYEEPPHPVRKVDVSDMARLDAVYDDVGREALSLLRNMVVFSNCCCDSLTHFPGFVTEILARVAGPDEITQFYAVEIVSRLVHRNNDDVQMALLMEDAMGSLLLPIAKNSISSALAAAAFEELQKHEFRLRFGRQDLWDRLRQKWKALDSAARKLKKTEKALRDVAEAKGVRGKTKRPRATKARLNPWKKFGYLRTHAAHVSTAGKSKAVTGARVVTSGWFFHTRKF